MIGRRHSIVVVGSVNLDLVCTARRIPVPGETVWGDSFQQFHGGKGANQAVAAARLGADVAMVARVGNDRFGEDLREGLRQAGVDVEQVRPSPGASGVALISVAATGQNSIVVVPGANARLMPADLEQSLPLLEGADLLLTQLEIPLETVEFLCEVAQRSGLPLMLDPAPARELPPRLLRSVTFLTPNESEAAALAGIPPEEVSPETVGGVARELRAQGPANVIVTMGARGAFLLQSDGRAKAFPGFCVPAVDTTAAGDAFNGGCAAALVRGFSLEAAVRYGMAAAAVSVTRAGAQPALPNGDEVEALLARPQGERAGREAL